MNAHVRGVAAAGDVEATFRFAVGDFVDHKDGGWPGLIMSRALMRLAKDGTAIGEVYGVQLVGGNCAGEERPFMGQALVAA